MNRIVKQLFKHALALTAYLVLSSCGSSNMLQKEIALRFHPFVKVEKTIPIDSVMSDLLHVPVSQREDSLVPYMLNGGMPAYNFHFQKVAYTYRSPSGKKFRVRLWVSPDYLSVGNNEKFVRMPLTPQSAQLVADTFHALLPTTKMVDEIYKAASVKLAPVPLTENRDSLATFIKHNEIIEDQLKRKIPDGIVAGIKKDVVQSNAVFENPKSNRVAIYGWHQLNGIPIQPLYTGHVDWYVDYSHGIRLIYEKMSINNKIYFVKDVLNDPELSGSICDESNCKLMRYVPGK
ncbi:MAG: hypothetical protein KDC56_07890 [Flavobacteriaceae bacterium]|nr:hypothetical protein [Flavobacteriaceae bacterium]